MDVVKRVEDLLKSRDVTKLELLVEEKPFFGGFRPVSFGQRLGPRKDSRNIGPKKQFIKYIYRFDVKLCLEIAWGLLESREGYDTEASVNTW